MNGSKPLPPLSSDDDAGAFVAEADLTRFDLTGFTATRFAFEGRGEHPPSAEKTLCVSGKCKD